MRLNDIFCIIRVAAESPRTALEQAIALAKAKDAHLTIIVAAQMTMPLYSPVYSTLAASLINEVNTKTKSLADKTAEMAQQATRIAGVTADITSKIDMVGSIAATALRQARMSDLVIVDQTAGYADTREVILEEMLFHSGRPVLVATPKAQPMQKFHRIMIAWDGSAHAARSASDALSMFPEIKTVEIVSIVGEKDLSKMVPGADYARHLSRKGVETILTDLTVGKEGVAAMLDAHAVKTKADLLVMGGFGHSRWREFIFGGVTLSLTQSASVPLLMAH